jgi:hypothetical protein
MKSWILSLVLGVATLGLLLGYLLGYRHPDGSSEAMMWVGYFAAVSQLLLSLCVAWICSRTLFRTSGRLWESSLAGFLVGVIAITVAGRTIDHGWFGSVFLLTVPLAMAVVLPSAGYLAACKNSWSAKSA